MRVLKKLIRLFSILSIGVVIWTIININDNTITCNRNQNDMITTIIEEYSE